MASTLSCVGLSVDSPDDLGDVIGRLEPEPMGSVDGVDVVRFTDPGGARILMAIREGEALDLVPTFAAAPAGALLGGLGVIGEHVVADVLDPESGETQTRFCCDLEQARWLPAPTQDPVPAAVVALGIAMTVHADAAAFEASEASALTSETTRAEPTRFASESFVSFGMFGDDQPDPTAFLAGTVLTAGTRTTRATGESFHAVEVRTVGFTVTACLPASEHPTCPEPGMVVAGTCYLVADAPSLAPARSTPRRRRGWFRSRGA